MSNDNYSTNYNNWFDFIDKNRENYNQLFNILVDVGFDIFKVYSRPYLLQMFKSIYKNNPNPSSDHR
jgi:hypothetical protein